jgi:hypothetical protein
MPISVIPLLFLITDNYLLAGVINNNNGGDENNEHLWLAEIRASNNI